MVRCLTYIGACLTLAATCMAGMVQIHPPPWVFQTAGGVTPFWWDDQTYDWTVIRWPMTNNSSVVTLDNSYLNSIGITSTDGLVTNKPGGPKPTWVGPTNGMAPYYQFGATSYLYNANMVGFTNATKGCVSWWQKWPNAASSYSVMLAGDDLGGSVGAKSFRLDGIDDRLLLYDYTNGVLRAFWMTAPNSTDFIANQWARFSVWSDGVGSYAFINGVPQVWTNTLFAGGTNRWFKQVFFNSQPKRFVVGTGIWNGWNTYYGWPSDPIWNPVILTNSPTGAASIRAMEYTNRTMEAIQRGVVNGFWTNSAALFALWSTSCVLEVNFNNGAQEGSTNATALAVNTAPVAVSVTSPATTPPNGKGAFDLDGTNDRWSFTGNNNYFTNKNYSGTVITWCRIEGVTNGNYELLKFSDMTVAGDTKDAWGTRVLARAAAPKGLGFVIDSNQIGTNDTLIGNTVLSLNTWYCYIVTSSGTSWTMWLNGAPEPTSVSAGSNTGEWLSDLRPNIDTALIGATGYNEAIIQHFNGKLGYVCLLRAVMPGPMVTNFWNSTKGAYGL